jgi:hypothetical protein
LKKMQYHIEFFFMCITFFFIFIIVLGMGTLWHLQKFLQCVKYIKLEFGPSTCIEILNCWSHHKKGTKVEWRKIEEMNIRVIIHIYMEISQRTSLCSYLYLKQKCHFFLLENQRTGGQNRSCPGWGWCQWEEGGGRE